jgi:hypothetical protein
MLIKHKFLLWKYRSRSYLPNPQVWWSVGGGVERSRRIELSNGGPRFANSSDFPFREERLFIPPVEGILPLEISWPVVLARLGGTTDPCRRGERGRGRGEQPDPDEGTGTSSHGRVVPPAEPRVVPPVAVPTTRPLPLETY